MTALMGEPPSYRWTRLVLFFGFGLFGCYYAIINDSSPTLAFGLGTLMLGIALFSRPLGHFSDFLGRSTVQGLSSSPAVLFMWVGGWTLYLFGLVARLAL
jgi:hypothetical protein